MHISTQVNITNLEAVEFYSQWADTMVLARELNLDQVRAISDGISARDIRGPHGRRVALEMFCHGALCMAVSGKCYLSLHEMNSSANRGACTQICRRGYTVTDRETGDSLDHYRLDYNRLAQGKLESVSRNTSTVKTLTVTVRESDEQAAVASLNALCNNLVSQMRSIDACKATRLDREHRLRLMAEVLRPGEEFRFDERRFEHQPGKPDTKDLVCPWSIDARNPTMLDIESLDSKYLHRTMWVSGLPPELSDQLVNDLTGLRVRVDVSIHLAPMDRGESMTLVRRKNAEVKMQIMDQRRENRKQGLDPDDLPDDLADQQEQLRALGQGELQRG